MILQWPVFSHLVVARNTYQQTFSLGELVMGSWECSLICQNGLVDLFNLLIESTKNTALASYVGERRLRSAEDRVG